MLTVFEFLPHIMKACCDLYPLTNNVSLLLFVLLSAFFIHVNLYFFHFQSVIYHFSDVLSLTSLLWFNSYVCFEKLYIRQI